MQAEKERLYFFKELELAGIGLESFHASYQLKGELKSNRPTIAKLALSGN